MSQHSSKQAVGLYGDPLQDGYIRVIRLLPNEQAPNTQNDIVGELEDIPLLVSSTSHINPSKYDSLSYAWGQDGVGRNKGLKFSRKNRRSGQVVTEIVSVTPSVANAVHQLRQHSDPRSIETKQEGEIPNDNKESNSRNDQTQGEEKLPKPERSRRSCRPSPLLWIDQICINQDDPDEKRKQISIMAKIYEMSSSVLVWLGLGTETSNKAIDYLNEISLAFATDKTPQGYAYKSEKAQAIQHLLSRSWFERAWTLQEAANARDCKVLCGTKTIDYSRLHQFYSGCQGQRSRVWRDMIECIATAGPNSAPNDERALLAHILTIAKFKEIREQEQTGKTDAALAGSALMQFNRLRNCKTQHASDKIFSMWYNLPQSIKRAVGSPDYEIPVEELYRRVAEGQLCQEGNIMYLAGAGTYRRNLALPSWVPDYTHPETHYSFAVLDEDCLHRTGKHLFYATSARGEPANISGDGCTLKLKGHILGDVRDVTQPFHFSTGNNLNQLDRLRLMMKEIRQHLEYCERLVEDEQLDYTDLNSLTVLRHTLTCGMEVLGGGPSFGGVFVPAPAHEINPRFDALKRYMEAGERMTGGPVVTSRMLPNRRTEDGGQEEGGLQILVNNITPTASLINLTAFTQSSEQARAVLDPFVAACGGRSFFVTKDHHMGLAPSVIRPMDKVCVIHGSRVPFIVRPIEQRKIKMADDVMVKSQCYVLIGECYVHGFMNGEAVKEGIVESDDIYLI